MADTNTALDTLVALAESERFSPQAFRHLREDETFWDLASRLLTSAEQDQELELGSEYSDLARLMRDRTRFAVLLRRIGLTYTYLAGESVGKVGDQTQVSHGASYAVTRQPLERPGKLRIQAKRVSRDVEAEAQALGDEDTVEAVRPATELLRRPELEHRLEVGRKYLNAALRVEPNLVTALNNLGLNLIHDGLPAEAFEHLNRGLELLKSGSAVLDPGATADEYLGSLLNSKGLGKHVLGDHAGALELFEQAIVHDRHPVFLTNIVEMLLLLNRRDEAAARLASIEPDELTAVADAVRLDSGWKPHMAWFEEQIANR